MSNVYAGIGSRETPVEILNLMIMYAGTLAKKSYWCRTGNAAGADRAFAIGADNKAINYLPWEGYNFEGMKGIIGSKSPTNEAIKLASEFHPAWDKCSQGARKLHGRNSHIILGRTLDKPVEFVICYAKPIFDKSGKDTGNVEGGTGLGVRIARKYNIPVYNLYDNEQIYKLVKTFAIL